MELKELYALMERFEKSGLSEIVYKKDGEEVCLKKAGPTVPVYAAPAAALPALHPAHEAAPVKHGADTEFIRAPLVGTFYRAPAPDADPYVDLGDLVEVGQTVCIIEAMKLMNEIESEHRGRVVKVLVENAQPVEFGQVLFRVEP